jgi:hypothetical protein
MKPEPVARTLVSAAPRLVSALFAGSANPFLSEATQVYFGVEAVVGHALACPAFEASLKHAPPVSQGCPRHGSEVCPIRNLREVQ